ncbi:MAG: toll/interleukin-1 receptor domain-containing protein [Deltaproteobacteria bacterium]|nr:toll/interleukin-1 receptor domain-containing protein [Deltaproteobacteria bacterium]
MKILISHVSDEALFALLLKDFIESTFLGQFEVFLSSNSGERGVGDKWLVELDSSLTTAELLLVLCSPKSIRQPWIHFEFGCAWTKSMAITCICHSGLNKVGLPPHLRTFDVLEVEDDDFMEQLFNDLAKRFGIKRLPRLSYDTMKAELRATLVSLASSTQTGDRTISRAHLTEGQLEVSTGPQTAPASGQGYTEPMGTKTAKTVDETPPEIQLVEEGLDEEIDVTIEEKLRERKEAAEPKPQFQPKPQPQPRSSPGVVVKKKKKRGKKKDETAEPESVQKRVLTLLSEAGDTGYPLEDLSDLLGIVGPKLEPYLDVLKEQAYINISVEVGRPPEYKIAAKGEQYLAESEPA